MGTFVVSLILVVIVLSAVRTLIKSRRSGAGCMSCGAAGACPHCHPAKKAHSPCCPEKRIP